MAITRKSRQKAHSFENHPPAQCLYPVADPRRETTATPVDNQRTTSTKPFPIDEGMLEMNEPRFIFDSHTNGKLRGGRK